MCFYSVLYLTENVHYTMASYIMTLGIMDVPNCAVAVVDRRTSASILPMRIVFILIYDCYNGTALGNMLHCIIRVYIHAQSYAQLIACLEH